MTKFPTMCIKSGQLEHPSQSQCLPGDKITPLNPFVLSPQIRKCQSKETIRPVRDNHI